MRRLLGSVIAATLVFAACGGGQDPSLQPPPGDGDGPDAPTVSAIVAEDQTTDGTTIVVDEAAVVGSDGFIVIHADNDGPGPVVGHVAIPEGESLQVEVKLDEPIDSGVYHPMIHIDAGELGVYEFPGPDVPAQVDGEIVMTRITVTVE